MWLIKIFNELISKKWNDNSAFLSSAEYEECVKKVESLKVKDKKTSNEFRFLQRYDTISVNEQKKLIKPISSGNDKIVYYIKNEDLFEVLWNTHSSIGHGSRNRMEYECKKLYCNVTRECIMEFLKLCVACQKKSTNKKRGFSIKAYFAFRL